MILIIFNYNLMSKYLKMLGQGLKYSLYFGTASLAGSALYLTYINSQLGSIQLDPNETAKYYSAHAKQFNMSESEAKNMYYWLLLDISMMRVFTYYSYTTSCSKINRKILDKSLRNYEEKNIIKQIEAVNTKPNRVEQKKIFNKILEIRKLNFQNLQDYEFVVKELRKQQKMMDTRKILGLEGERLRKLQTIHKFLCKFGEVFNHAEIKKYNEQVPGLQEIYPGDYVHKILVV